MASGTLDDSTARGDHKGLDHDVAIAGANRGALSHGRSSYPDTGYYISGHTVAPPPPPLNGIFWLACTTTAHITNVPHSHSYKVPGWLGALAEYPQSFNFGWATTHADRGAAIDGWAGHGR
jgi:hypothetical protein